MKNIWLSLLAFILGITVLGACSNSNPGTKKTPEPQSATSTPAATPTKILPTTTQLPDINVEAASLKGLQIQFMHPWSDALGIEMAKMIDEFNQNNTWGIFVNAQTPGSAGMLTNQLVEDIATGNQPDLVAAPVDTLLKIDTSEHAIVDLNPYVYSSQWGMTPDELADFDPIFLEQDHVKGFRYGFPAQRSTVMMFYNSTWAKELGFSSPPTAPQDFQNQACAAFQALKNDSESSNDGLGGWIVNTEGLVTYSWLVNFNTAIVANGNYTFTSPAAQTAFETILGLLTSGCAWIPRQATPYDYFASRQALIYSGYLQDILPQIKANSLAGISDNWTVIPFPSTQEQRVVAEGPSYAVMKSTPEKQLAAWLFVRWMSSPDYQVRIVQTSGTLPLSTQVKNQLMTSGSMSQQWKDAVGSTSQVMTVPSDPNWQLAKTIIEDAGWQLFKTNLVKSDIPALLAQMDSTFIELKDRK